MKRIVARSGRDQPAGRLRRLRRPRPADHADRRPAHPGARHAKARSRSIRRSPTCRSPCRGRSLNTDWAQPGGNAVQVDGPCRARRHARPGLERQHRQRQQLPQPAWPPSRWSPTAASTRSTRWRRVRAFNADTGAPDLGAAGARREQPERDPVRRRRQLRRRPHLRDQRRRRRRRARRRDRRRRLEGEAGRAAARRADRRQRQRLCDQPGQPALRAQRRRTARRAGPGAGSFELAGVFGSAAPAFAQSTVVAGFSSGELTAYRYENGQVVWQDALARTGISHRRRHALRHRRRSGDRQWPRLRDRPGRPHGRGRADHRPARLGDQHRRHLDALGGGRLGVRRHRPGAAARRRARVGPDPLDRAAAAFRRPNGERARPQDGRSGCGRAGPDLLARPGARRQPAGPDQLARPDRLCLAGRRHASCRRSSTARRSRCRRWSPTTRSTCSTTRAG